MTTAIVPTWDLADRMRKALREADCSVQEMATYLEVSRNTVGTWINGHNRPSAATLRLWALRCGVAYEWLRGADSSTPRELLPHLDSNQKPFDCWLVAA